MSDVPSNHPQPGELTDEQYEALLKDPDFVRKLDEARSGPPGAKSSGAWPWGWHWVGGAALRWIAVVGPLMTFEAYRAHQVQAEGSMRRLLDGLGMVKGESFLETFCLQALHPGHFQIYVLSFIACILALHPHKVTSRIAFWIGLPLASAPGVLNALKGLPMPFPFSEAALMLLPRFVSVWLAYALADWLIRLFWLRESNPLALSANE